MAKKWPPALSTNALPGRCAARPRSRPISESIASNPRAPSAPALWFMVADPTATEFRASGGPLAREFRGKSCGPIELLTEVPIAPSLQGIRPIPAQVQRRRRRHGSGGNDGAQRDAVEDAPVVGLPDPRPHGPHDLGGFHGHSAGLAHRDMGPSGCDGAMSNRDVTGFDGGPSTCARDVTGFDRDAPMSACDATGSDVEASMSNHDVAGYRAIFA
jgi:hypothetical protein